MVKLKSVVFCGILLTGPREALMPDLASFRGHMSEKLLTFSDVARKANVDRTTLYAWERNGRFPVKPFDDKKPRRWREAEIIEWLTLPNDQPRFDGV